jgi:signal transduction histidine kinase
MEKNLEKSKTWSGERKVLIALTLAFAVVILTGWAYALRLRQEVAANNSIMNVDPGAVIAVERIRNTAESQIANSRSFFLLGSTALLDKQKKDKQALTEALASFEKQYSLPQIPAILKRIDALEQQQEEIFDQAMDFREKRTESKIVGQFYQSKVTPIRTQLNESLDEIVRVHNSELERARKQAREAAHEAEVQIPRGMTWFTSLLAGLFVCVALLVVRMLRIRANQVDERNRLYLEAQKALRARDEVTSALSQDFKEPLSEILAVATSVGGPNAEAIKTAVTGIEDSIRDICDQKKADLGSLTLRLDQFGVDEILDEARLMLQPLAQQRDVRLQFDSVNPPVLAFFDRERVIRVLSNLVGNAIKFSPKHSKVIVKVRSDQKFVYISVADSGPGIPEGKISEIFGNFWQARKTADQGAGVGLAIVKTIIDAHGGVVSAQNQGQGTTFTFSLPRRRPVGAHIKKPAPMVRHKAAVPTQLLPDIQEGPNASI